MLYSLRKTNDKFNSKTLGNFNCLILSFFCSLFHLIGAVGGDDANDDDKEKAEEEERERQEAIREAEERRKEKHRKMEEEREKMRQEIRDKVSMGSNVLMYMGIAFIYKRGFALMNHLFPSSYIHFLLFYGSYFSPSHNSLPKKMKALIL